MKQFLLAALLFSFVNNGFSQNIGIGTTTPNSKALLDISSTTKGVLLPGMTTSQRLAISTPPNGLLVFDNDKNELHQYSGGSWTPILNGNYWLRPTANRSRIANINDSVGIGTYSPTEWLDVNGNIRTRNNLLADNDISATGNIGAGSMSTSGNLTVGGNAFANGTISGNSDIIINNSAAILQLRNGSNVNTGFLQLSGNNVRLGTNSGNTTGNVVVRMNGNDRVTINPAGDIDLDGKITTPATGTINLLPLCMGQVNSDGTIASGTGNFTVTKDPIIVGQYSITCTGINSNSIFFSAVPYQTATSSPFYASPNKMLIRTWSSTSGTREDHDFYFIVYKL